MKFFTKKQKATGKIPKPCIVLGTEIAIDVELFKLWRYDICGTYDYYADLEPYGIIVTQTINKGHWERLTRMIEMGYDPIFLAGDGFFDDERCARNTAAIAWGSPAKIIDCSGRFATTAVPTSQLKVIIDFYREGLCILINEDISQKERAGRWLAAHGVAMVDGKMFEFGKDIDYLRRTLRQYEIQNVEEIVKEVYRLYGRSEDRIGPLHDSEQSD